MVKKNLDDLKELEYIKNKSTDDKRLFRTEIMLTPLLVLAPLIVGFLLIHDWYFRDFLWDELDLFGELLLGFIIIIGNILFDIPFLKSLRSYSRKKN